MFGLFMLILFIVVWFVANIQTNNDVRNRKKRAKEKGQEFYLDRNGTMVDAKTDIPYIIRRMDDGDVWKVNPYSDKPLENISAQKRIKTDAEEKAKAIKEGKSVYPFEGYITHDKDTIVGVRFKDLKTGDVYVKRRLLQGVWLLNIRTCNYDRADDNFIDKTFSIVSGYEIIGGMQMAITKEVDSSEAAIYLNKKNKELYAKESHNKWDNNHVVNS